MIRLAVLFLCMLLASPVGATTYYVATTGNDTTGTGAIDNPWRQPQKCVSSGTPLVAGDTCLVGNGTYTDTNSDGYVINIGASAPAGTSVAPITIKSQNPLGAVLDAPTTSGAGNRAGVVITRPYYIIEGFDITQSGTALGTHNHGFVATSGATGLRIRRNTIHDIARTACLASGANSGGTLPGSPKNVTVEFNVFHNIGRLRNGESGCSVAQSQEVLDHGLYFSGLALNMTIKHNVFYRMTSGYAVHVYTGNGVHSDIYVYNNTFAGHPSQGTPKAPILLSGSLTNVQVKNNIISGTSSLFAVDWYLASASNVVLSYNLSNTTTFANPLGKPASGLTESNNTVNTSAGFTDAGSRDYTLASGSAAINAGTNISLPFSGSAPDQGAFETFGPVSASITASLLDVTYSPAFGPIQVGGATGHSVGCTVACGTLSVANASLFSSASSIARYTVSGFSGGNCVDTQTITKSFNAATGTLTDSINIGGTRNQPVHTYGPIAVTNNCDGGGSPTPPDPSHILYELDGDEADTSGNGLDGTRSGGSYVAGKYGQALQGTAGVAVSVTAPYGEDVNPSTQDITIVVGYEVPAGQESAFRTIAGTALGDDQRMYIASICGTWQIAIATSGISCDTPSNLAVHAGWNRLVLHLNSTTDVATLSADNVTGTGGATKAIPDYTLASNIAFGLPSGFSASSAGGGKWDRAVIYTSLISVSDDWLAWEPTASPPVGTYAQTGARWLRVMDDGAAGHVLYSESGTVNCVQGGAIIHQSRTTCSGANCSAIGEKLWYTHDGGTAQEVPNSFTSTGVSFWGANTSAHMFLGAASWSPSTDGTTQILNVAQPTIELEEDDSIVRNSVLRFADDATGTYCFHERDQSGNELDSVPTACVVVIPPQASGGF